MRERLDGIERIAAQVQGMAAGDPRRAARQASTRAWPTSSCRSIPAGSSRKSCSTCRRSTSTRSSTASPATSPRRGACSALPEAVGRRLDFLMQEFNREANTLGSKSVDARTTQAAVELKVLIEQLREQVQNLE